jgi:hypothetical protein
MTLDDVVPHPQHRMCHSRTVSAPPAAVWDELCRVTMSALPLGICPQGHPAAAFPAGRQKHQPLAGPASNTTPTASIRRPDRASDPRRLAADHHRE